MKYFINLILKYIIIIIFFLSINPIFAYENELKNLAEKLSKILIENNIKKVAVADFVDCEKNITEFGIVVVEKLIIYLSNLSKEYTIIDRSHLHSILKEQKLALLGITDPENLKKLGQISGVDAIIVGTISTRYDYVEIAAKILDIFTAEVKGGEPNIYILKTKSIEDQLNKVVDLEPPSILILRLKDNDRVSGKIKVSVNVFDNEGVSKVDFYIDDVLIHSKANPPYDLDLDTTLFDNGTRILKVKATDKSKNESFSQIRLIFQNKIPEKIPPSVKIISPKDKDILSGNVNINVDAKDNEGIAKVELFIGGKLYDTKILPPFSFLWDTKKYNNGDYEIIARATDLSGNYSIHKINVKINNDTKPPTVRILSPKDFSIVSGVVDIYIDSSDDKGISTIEIYVEDLLVKKFNVNSLYFYNFYSLDTRKLEDGKYKIEVLAYDIDGNESFDTIYLDVKNKKVEDISRDYKKANLILGVRLIPTDLGIYYGGSFEKYLYKDYILGFSFRISFNLLPTDQYMLTFFEGLLLLYLNLNSYDIYTSVGIGSRNILYDNFVLFTSGIKFNLSIFSLYGEFTLTSTGEMFFPCGLTISF